MILYVERFHFICRLKQKKQEKWIKFLRELSKRRASNRIFRKYNRVMYTHNNISTNSVSSSCNLQWQEIDEVIGAVGTTYSQESTHTSHICEHWTFCFRICGEHAPERQFDLNFPLQLWWVIIIWLALMDVCGFVKPNGNCRIKNFQIHTYYTTYWNTTFYAQENIFCILHGHYSS